MHTAPAGPGPLSLWESSLGLPGLTSQFGFEFGDDGVLKTCVRVGGARSQPRGIIASARSISPGHATAPWSMKYSPVGWTTLDPAAIVNPTVSRPLLSLALNRLPVRFRAPTLRANKKRSRDSPTPFRLPHQRVPISPAPLTAHPCAILKLVEAPSYCRIPATGFEPPYLSPFLRVTQICQTASPGLRHFGNLKKSSSLRPVQNNVATPGLRHPRVSPTLPSARGTPESPNPRKADIISI